MWRGRLGSRTSTSLGFLCCVPADSVLAAASSTPGCGLEGWEAVWARVLQPSLALVVSRARLLRRQRSSAAGIVVAAMMMALAAAADATAGGGGSCSSVPAAFISRSVTAIDGRRRSSCFIISKTLLL